jgi:hypothetical protein
MVVKYVSKSGKLMDGEIEEFALKQGITLKDLKDFSDLTKSAFKEGKR